MKSVLEDCFYQRESEDPDEMEQSAPFLSASSLFSKCPIYVFTFSIGLTNSCQEM